MTSPLINPSDRCWLTLRSMAIQYPVIHTRRERAREKRCEDWKERGGISKKEKGWRWIGFGEKEKKIKFGKRACSDTQTDLLLLLHILRIFFLLLICRRHHHRRRYLSLSSVWEPTAALLIAVSQHIAQRARINEWKESQSPYRATTSGEVARKEDSRR